MKLWNTAVVGATGVVGREVLKLFDERQFPAAAVKLLASSRSRGSEIDVLGRRRVVEVLEEGCFADSDIVFFCAGGQTSSQWVPAAADAGALVIDNSSAFRLDPKIPLIVPEVNGDQVPTAGIAANPNCSTILLAVVLKPLHEAAELARVVVSTYQAVSGAGAGGITELEDQVTSHVGGLPLQANVLPVAADRRHYPIAFNAIPQIDLFGEDGYTKEEWKMILETKKILNLPDLAITATTVRIPVLRSHCESVNIEFQRPLAAAKAREILENAPGVAVIDDPANQRYPMPIETSGKDPVFVGRIRRDPTVAHGINLWLAGDQIRKGAALNALQIAELWAQRR